MSNEILSLRVEDAIKYGTDCALLLYNFRFWIKTNFLENRNQHEGKTWTYNSHKAFMKWFPFLSEDQIQRAMIKLCGPDGPLMKGNFNKMKNDKTTWYAFKDESFLYNQLPRQDEKDLDSNPQNCGMEHKNDEFPAAKLRNARRKNADTLPDLNHIDKNIYILSQEQKAPSVTKVYISLNREKEEFEGITQEDLDLWMKTYTNCNVMIELEGCLIWALHKKKEKANWKATIVNWLKKAHEQQDKTRIRNLELVKKIQKQLEKENLPHMYVSKDFVSVKNYRHIYFNEPCDEFEQSIRKAARVRPDYVFE